MLTRPAATDGEGTGEVASTPSSPRSIGAPPTPPAPAAGIRGGGSIGRECMAERLEGEDDICKVPVRELQRGDVVRTAYHGLAKIVCVVVTPPPATMYAATTKDPGVGQPGPPLRRTSVVLTGWHPFLTEEGTWAFPVEQWSEVDYPYDEVWNFLLAPRDNDSFFSPTILVDSTACVTLGHGLLGGRVMHPYWGWDVVGALASLPGWEEGRISLASRRETRAALPDAMPSTPT